jgi:translation elongation factor EF-4
METTFQIDSNTVIMTSAKQNIGVLDVLEAIVDILPSPRNISSHETTPFRGRIVDSWFDEHRGVVCLVQVIGGVLTEGQRISNFASVKEFKDIDDRVDFSVQEIGVLTPTALRTQSIRPGQVGYIIAGMRSTRQARIGDTMYIPSEWESSSSTSLLQPLEGYEAAKQMLFASIFPVDTNDLEALFAAVDRLLLNDSSISVTREYSTSLGSGLRCGFLGFLHMEVFNQRLQDEYNVEIVVTTPSVPYIIKYDDGTEMIVSNTQDWPHSNKARKFQVFEPIVKILLITPQTFYGDMMELIKERRGENVEVTHLDDSQVLIVALVNKFLN